MLPMCSVKQGLEMSGQAYSFTIPHADQRSYRYISFNFKWLKEKERRSMNQHRVFFKQLCGKVECEQSLIKSMSFLPF